jgi:predicted RNA-binding protein
VSYWLISLPRPDMEHCIKKGIFGMTRKYVLGKIQPGDKLGCYVTKECKIIALGETTSAHYLDNEPVFLREGHFFERFNFEAQRLEIEIDFKPLIDKVDFIKNLAYWSVYLSRSIVQITEKDWTLIEAAAEGIGQ